MGVEMTESLVLLEHPLSPYAQKVKICLRFKGLSFDAQLPGGLGQDQVGSLLEANPRSEVPTLQHEGATLFDSTIILEYLEDRFPEPALMPSGPAARAAARTIEDVMDTHYEAINWGLGELVYFKRAEGSLREQILERAAEQTRRLQRWLSAQLSENLWFGGDAFGWADVAVVPYLNASASFDLGPEPGSPLAAWLTRINERPEVAETTQEALRSAAGMEQVAELVRQGAFKRHYRDHRLEWMIKSGGLEVVSRGLEAGSIRFTDF